MVQLVSPGVCSSPGEVFEIHFLSPHLDMLKSGLVPSNQFLRNPSGELMHGQIGIVV